MTTRDVRAAVVALAAVFVLPTCYGCGDRGDAGLPEDRWSGQEELKTSERQTSDEFAQRRCSLIALDPEKVDEYKGLHEDVPPAAVAAMRRANIHNLSIFIRLVDEQFMAIRYYEYTGDNHAADWASLNRDPDFRQWRNAYEAHQVPVSPRLRDQWWAPAEEIFHAD